MISSYPDGDSSPYGHPGVLSASPSSDIHKLGSKRVRENDFMQVEFATKKIRYANYASRGNMTDHMDNDFTINRSTGNAAQATTATAAAIPRAPISSSSCHCYSTNHLSEPLPMVNDLSSPRLVDLSTGETLEAVNTDTIMSTRRKGNKRTIDQVNESRRGERVIKTLMIGDMGEDRKTKGMDQLQHSQNEYENDEWMLDSTPPDKKFRISANIEPRDFISEDTVEGWLNESQQVGDACNYITQATSFVSGTTMISSDPSSPHHSYTQEHFPLTVQKPKNLKLAYHEALTKYMCTQLDYISSTINNSRKQLVLYLPRNNVYLGNLEEEGQRLVEIDENDENNEGASEASKIWEITENSNSLDPKSDMADDIEMKDIMNEGGDVVHIQGGEMDID
ncbi:5300_t:CDS:1 [Paraglomus occultum]|uniref:5300_t:CDS:1 n=1 Tax=Paraglomus occultum TaxID=144539 RepID=A0A9N9BNZ4_9GLOM|nr:5300_t:CDS:1 [Paraglomus occultum]